MYNSYTSDELYNKHFTNNSTIYYLYVRKQTLRDKITRLILMTYGIGEYHSAVCRYIEQKRFYMYRTYLRYIDNVVIITENTNRNYNNNNNNNNNAILSTLRIKVICRDVIR